MRSLVIYYILIAYLQVKPGTVLTSSSAGQGRTPMKQVVYAMQQTEDGRATIPSQGVRVMTTSGQTVRFISTDPKVQTSSQNFM